MDQRKRRGHGEGAVYQPADGYWVASVEAGRCSGGHARKDGTHCPGGERRRARIVRTLRPWRTSHGGSTGVALTA